jgi:hypothetical protein
METRRALKRLNDRKLTDVRPGDEVIPGLLTIVSPNIGCSTMDDGFGCVFRQGMACPTYGDQKIGSPLCISRKAIPSESEMWFVDKQEYATWKITN